MFSFFKKVFSKKELPTEKEKTRMVKSKDGVNVELFEDMPDSYADAIGECWRTGKMVSGRIDEKGILTIGGSDETLG